MSTIKQFEDLEIWQLARELCDDVYKIITTTPLGNSYKLRDQIDSSSGSIMDNTSLPAGRSPRVSNEMGRMSLDSFYLLQKARVAKQDHNFTECLTENISIKRNLKKQKIKQLF